MTRRLMFLGLFLLLAASASAGPTPVTGFLEATAADGWQGHYTIRLSDRSIVTGTVQVFIRNFSALRLVTTGCTGTPSTGCMTVNGSTQTLLALNVNGSAILAGLGSVTWVVQTPYVMPGEPSPDVAVLGDVDGTLGTDTVTSTPYDFIFNANLTVTFAATANGQAVASLRIDFTDDADQPKVLDYWDGHTYINEGTPVALGSPLRPKPRKGKR